MKNKGKSRLLVSLILSAILLTSFPLRATASKVTTNDISVSYISTSTTPEHKRIVNGYINQLVTIQNMTFQLMYLALDNPIKDIPNFNSAISLLNDNAADLRSNILVYQETLPTSSIQYRDILLILNALNYSKNAIFNLELLAKTTNNVERALLLENFFKSRIESTDALNTVNNLISNNQ
ncbi:MAG: hypothetical protein AB9856_03760 [Cellulosilyticaceae bacterium]